MDTGKIGGNKYVDYKFSDFQKDRGLSDIGMAKEFDKYGYSIEDFKPIAPVTERADTFRERLQKAGLNYLPLPLQVGGAKFNEQVYDPKRGVFVGKNRPTGLLGGIASYVDGLTYGLTDFDQLGGGLLGSKKSLRGFGGAPTDYELPADLKETLALQDKAKKEKESKDPVDNIPEIIKAEKDYQKEMAPFNRRQRILDSVTEFLNYALTSPKMFKDLRRETDYAVRRGLQAELRRQAMPDAEQARRIAASAGFATEAEAIAKQQQAATELAKAGVRTPTATFSA
jgi:hypothetical protein